MKKYLTIFSIAITACGFLSVVNIKEKSDNPNSCEFIFDMVCHTPGEPLTVSSFNDPEKLIEYGYNGQAVAKFSFIHSALTFDKLNPDIFPEGSEERKWVLNRMKSYQEEIKAIKKTGLKVYCFMDIIVLPKKLVELYKDEICNKDGKITFLKPKTVEIHRIMLDELFERFPDIDGLIIRTGENYLMDVPYHTGNSAITDKQKSHIILINLLREEVCEKMNKLVFYRTWSFDGFHTDPAYYLSVTDSIKPHKNLVFSIKHTNGDFWRTFPFNKTLTTGKHQQIVEVQCQREYEGKGSHPDYIAKSVIEGFEEYDSLTFPKCLNDIKNHPTFKGIWTWSRGGGWYGPYITNELWCDLNAFVLCKWAQNINRTEEDIFNEYMDRMGLKGESRSNFRKLCLLSPKGILRGHYTNRYPVNIMFLWTRDHYLGGPESYCLKGTVEKLYKYNKIQVALDEKAEAVKIWEEIARLSENIEVPNKETENYIRVSSKYGYYLYSIIYEGWVVMLEGYKGDQTGTYNKEAIINAIKKYDELWKGFENLKNTEPSCATLYIPYDAPEWHWYEKPTFGMKKTVDKYREMFM